MKVNPVRFAEALWNACLYAAKDGPTGASVALSFTPHGVEVFGFDGYVLVQTAVPSIGSRRIDRLSVMPAAEMKKIERDLRDSKFDEYPINLDLFPEHTEKDVWEFVINLGSTYASVTPKSWAVNPARLANLGRLKSGGEDPIDLRFTELSVGGHAWEFVMGPHVTGFVSVLDRDLLKEMGKVTW